MNKTRTAYSLVPFFALLSVSIPVFATDQMPLPTNTPTYTQECHDNGCGDACDKNEDMWTKVRERIACCECNTSKCSSSSDFVDPSTEHEWVLFQEKSDPNYTLFAGKRITGIECNTLLKAPPDYWRFAWDAAAKHLGPNYPDKIGLAINSKSTRSHNQLHIHVSCIDQDVHKTLEDEKNKQKMAFNNPENWRKSTLSLKNNDYHVLVLENVKTPIYTDSSGDHNLFQVLQKYVVKSGGEKMENQNLVVAKRQSGGFYILSGTSARGESLLDESCKW